MPHFNYLKQGKGPAVVLSHALGCDLGMWDGVAGLLQSHYTVVRYDHRGHGRSERAQGPVTLHALAGDAAALIEELIGDPVHFVGLSMGGMVAQELAVRYPHLVRSIVVANSTSWYDEAACAAWRKRIDTVKAQGMEPLADGAMERWFTPEFRADTLHGGVARVATLRQTLLANDPAAYAACCEAIAAIDLRDGNRHVACPTLVIAGGRDEGTPPAMSEQIWHDISGSQFRMLDTAHLSAVEQPQAFAALVTEFLEGI